MCLQRIPDQTEPLKEEEAVFFSLLLVFEFGGKITIMSEVCQYVTDYYVEVLD